MSKRSKIPQKELSESASTGLSRVQDPSSAHTAPCDTLRGSVDFLEHNTLFGSAWDASDQSQIVEVEIYNGEKLLSNAVADKHRQDLALATVGDGCHGFEFELPTEFDPRSMRVVFRNSDVELPNGPFFRLESDLPQSPDESVRDGLIELKNTLVDLENMFAGVRTTMEGLTAKLEGIEERVKPLAAKQDLGKVHNSLMSTITQTRETLDDISKSGTRIEGFLNIELGKRISKEFEINDLKQRFRKIDARLRSASLIHWFTAILILGFTAAMALSQPIDWVEELRHLFN